MAYPLIVTRHAWISACGRWHVIQTVDMMQTAIVTSLDINKPDGTMGTMPRRRNVNAPIQPIAALAHCGRTTSKVTGRRLLPFKLQPYITNFLNRIQHCIFVLYLYILHMWVHYSGSQKLGHHTLSTAPPVVWGPAPSSASSLLHLYCNRSRLTPVIILHGL